MSRSVRAPDYSLRVYPKHPAADAYRVGGSYTPYAIVATDKRFSDSELAAEVHAFILTDHKYPENPETYEDDDWEAYDAQWKEAQETLHRFATLPYFDE